MSLPAAGERRPVRATGVPDTVRVVGAGLLGASIGLGLRVAGHRVLLADPSPTALALATDVGAGEPDPGGVDCGLVVVACPPDVAGRVVLAELAAHPRATVTDVASVKAVVAEEVAAGAGVEAVRYVGGHPMAGRERSGPVAARADLFAGRPWVICAAPDVAAARLDAVRGLARLLGATAYELDAAAHDEAVALVSHLPQIASSLVAARLRAAPDGVLALAGQGLRDVTRIAASDPGLWAQILAGNAGPVRDALAQLRGDLDAVLGALDALAADAGAAPGARAAVASAVAAGNAGRERIPGKHGAPPTAYAALTVLIPDRPGSLGRLFAEIGAAGINIEEFSLEHSPGQPVGLAELSVLPAVRDRLEAELTTLGWHVAG